MLSRERIVDAAFLVLRDYGLADLSMRRLAKELGVQAGALYWHVPSKQDLLYGLAEVILDGVPIATGDNPGENARRISLNLRDRLLAVRDSAEVVSLAQALAPYKLAPFAQLRRILDSDADDGRGSRVLIHFILGALAEEQTRSSLIHSGAIAATQDGSADRAEQDFAYGIDAILNGLGAIPAQRA